MDLATALHKRCRKGALLFTFLAQKKRINILYCVLAVKLRSCRSKLLTSIPWETWNLSTRGVPWGVLKLTPRQNMRCGEKGDEIVTFRWGLLKQEVRSFTWLRHSSPRKKEPSRVPSGKHIFQSKYRNCLDNLK